MAQPPAPDKELRYRNVTIHSQGKTEHGTLHLLNHHALFSYHPGTRKGDGSGAHSRNVSGIHKPTEKIGSSHEGSEANGSSSSQAKSRPTGSEDANSNAKSQQKPGLSKTRPKEIWIPYPMIAFCILRPSHAASITARPSAPETSAQSQHGEDELFPPTFGTSGDAGSQRLSTDSSRLATFSAPPRSSSPSPYFESAATRESARQPVIRIRRKDFQMMALHFNSDDSGKPMDEAAREAFYALRARSCVRHIQALHAFHYQQHKDESNVSTTYDARREFARMGISPKAADGPGAAWRITDINQDYSYSRTYPNVLCVPKTVSDNTLKYGGVFRSKSRIPCLSYLHPNGGSISRCSQPLVGVNKRNPQDERLVQAIFSSHTAPLQSRRDSPPQGPSLTSPSSATLEASASDSAPLNSDNNTIPSSQSETALDEMSEEQPPGPKVYGSTRQNIIVDARPMANVIFNRAAGGGIEDTSHYTGNSQTPVEKILLNIANIHIMRKSLEKVTDSFGSADYVDMKADQEVLRRSGWLGHIAGLLRGSETVARVVGLGGSHAVVHCSDGWDRTSQVVALAQIMLDPHYRTLSGFISLVQKDFLSFGHKFRDRDGVEGSEKWFKIENERIVPSATDGANSDPKSLNAMGRSAFKGAQNWFAKNRSNLFSQQNIDKDAVSENCDSRPPSPPANPVIHSSPSSSSKDDKHTMVPDEVSPVFHQFLDTVYQLLHQQPNAFEFNERFLKRLFYQAYACQYGEFLFNTERDRSQHELPSVWGHFLSRQQEFTNPEYVRKVNDPLLFPRRTGAEREVEVRWWSGLFGRKDEDMNVPRALALADSAPHTASLRTSVSVEESAADAGEALSSEKPNGAIKETRSTPSLATMRDGLTNSFSSMTFRTNEARKESAPELGTQQPHAVHTPDVQTDDDVVQQPPDAQSSAAPSEATEMTKPDQMDMDEGDPLGVSSSAPKQVGRGGLDFAAFASQNAFRDR